MSAGLKLAQFSDEYLRLLGFSRFIDTLSPNDIFIEDIKLFEQYSLDMKKYCEKSFQK
jgi:hypothetical protein